MLTSDRSRNNTTGWSSNADRVTPHQAISSHHRARPVMTINGAVDVVNSYLVSKRISFRSRTGTKKVERQRYRELGREARGLAIVLAARKGGRRGRRVEGRYRDWTKKTPAVAERMERAKVLAREFDTLAAAWAFAERTLSSHRTRENLLNWISFLRLLTRTLENGASVWKDQTHAWRERACSKPVEPRRHAVFFASTGGRAINFPISDQDLEAATIEKELLWMAEAKTIDAGLLRELENFSYLVSSRLPRPEPYAPIPSGNACLEQPRKTGGQCAALVDGFRELRGFDFQVPAARPIDEVGGVWRRARSRGVFERGPTLTSILQQDVIDWSELQQATRSVVVEQHGRSYVINSPDPDTITPIGRSTPPTPEALTEFAMRLVELPGRRGFKALPLREPGGKVRIATIHPAPEAHVGRVLSDTEVARLQRHHWFRLGLSKEDTTEHLRRKHAHELTKIFSADLSAATDHFDRKVSGAILDGWARGGGWSQRKLNLARSLLGDHTVLADEEFLNTTQTSGILLGLGFTWTILSIASAFMGAYATRHDPALSNSFRVCGDDLVGLWTQDEIERYYEVAQRLGLVVNRRKSYEGVAGVFCERFVRQLDMRSALIHGRHVMREVVGTRPRFNHDGWSEYRTQLVRFFNEGHGLYRKIVRYFLNTSRHPQGVGGPASIGGDGGRVMDKTRFLIASAVNRGPVRKHRHLDENVEWAAANKSGGPVQPKSKLMGYALANWRARQIAEFNIPLPVLLRDQSTLHKIVRSRITTGRKTAQFIKASDALSHTSAKTRWLAKLRFGHLLDLPLSSPKIPKTMMGYLASNVLRKPDMNIQLAELHNLLSSEVFQPRDLRPREWSPPLVVTKRRR
nr:MAG: RNA-dependent RNA polymerase [Sanya narna-like virus 8]